MKKKHVLGIIPARLGSTRLKRKMLLDINGKPLLFYTWQRAKKAKLLDALIIATDSKEIKKAAEDFGADVVMTSTAIRSGSDRTAAAVKAFQGFTPDIAVNIQGDEPLIPPRAIDASIQALLDDPEVVVATPATPFEKEKDVRSPNFVKVVCDKKGNALYFSRSVIPFPRDEYKKYMKHLGLYCFRRDFLFEYVKMPQTKLEKAEKLEQLRILENGHSIRVVTGTFRNLEVNTLQEFKQVKALLEAKR